MGRLMPAGGVRIEGLTQVVRALQELGLEVDDLKGAFSSIASEAADIAASGINSQSGRAAATVRGNRAKNKAIVTAGRASVPYLGVINYGWPARGIDAQEFMQIADEQMQPIALDRLEDEINTAIRKRGLT